MSELDAGHRQGTASGRVLALAAVAALSLSACGSHAIAPSKAASSPTGVAASKTAVSKAAACARVLSITSQLSDIQAMVFQTMSVGSTSRVWGPIVMDLDKQAVRLKKEATARKLVCAGPAGQRTTAPSGRAATASGGATTAAGGATKASGGAAKAPRGAKAPRIDRAKVAALTAEVAGHPEATFTMQSLGDIYFFADDFRTASAWYQRVLDVEPKSEEALLALGSAQFNLENEMEAEKHWRVAEWLYPDSEDVHYDLGYLYQSQTPPDTAKMTAQWRLLIRINPGSDLAKLVAPQLK